jgi:plastocyanin
MMNSKIAVAIRPAVILVAAILTPPTTTTAILAYAVEEIAADITQGSSTKTTDAYSPNPIDSRVGDTVTWTNRDSTPHTVTSGVNGQPDGSFDSSPNFNPLMAPGHTFSHTFTEEGQYPYYCALHPNMVGTVIVAAAAAGGGGGNQTTRQEFRVTATDEEGNEHEITGISENVTATSFAINPGQSVQIQFDGTGEVELTLPKSLIVNITAVQAGTETIQHTSVNETDTATTISFEVPQDQTPVQIIGGFVVPEFPVIAAILAGTIVAVIGFSRFSRSRRVFFGGA